MSEGGQSGEELEAALIKEVIPQHVDIFIWGETLREVMWKFAPAPAAEEIAESAAEPEAE